MSKNTKDADEKKIINDVEEEKQNIICDVETNKELIIDSLPYKTKYKLGDKISYDGLKVKFDGHDVTKRICTSLDKGIRFCFVKDIDIIITFVDDDLKTHYSCFKLNYEGVPNDELKNKLIACSALGVGLLTLILFKLRK